MQQFNIIGLVANVLNLALNMEIKELSILAKKGNFSSYTYLEIYTKEDFHTI